ncbi:MAG: hypothetical protein VKP63_10190 [Cyanobacteriota bacterium]|nr:hypothetical protein [Cyanobacteriota bacterium]
MPKTPPSEPTRKRVARRAPCGHRLAIAMAALLPAGLMAACGILPLPGGGPQTDAGSSLPPTPKARQGGSTPSQPPPPALAPLATPQQVVKAVSVGRRDPFGNVLVPTVIQERQAPANGSAPSPALPRELAWPKGLAFEGVLQTSAESEAMVSYRPEDNGGGGPRAGSLRVGDVGTPGFDSLLPPGWVVAAIDGDRGVLVLRKGGQTVSRELQTP